MAQTNQYGIKQWEVHEGVHRESWNQAMASIDSALAEVATGANQSLSTAIDGVNQSLSTAINGVNQSVTATASQASQALAAETDARNSAIAGLQGQITALNTAKVGVVVGSYTGNGAESRDIYLGFAPKAVHLELTTGWRSAGGSSFAGLAIPGVPMLTPTNAPCLQLTATGFQVFYNEVNYSYSNSTAYSFCYTAIQ